MNIQTIHALAAKRFQEAYKEKILSENTIALPDYLCEEDFDLIVGDSDQLTFLESRLYSTIFAELLMQNGGEVFFMPMYPDNFFNWLQQTGNENNPGNRAAYCAILLQQRNS